MFNLPVFCGEAGIRPVGSTQQPVASTSPRCAALKRPLWRNENRRQLRCQSMLLPSVPAGGWRCVVAAHATPSPTVVTEDSSLLLADDLAVDPDDYDAVVEAAEAGGRTYLQLSDTSDASLQVRMVQWYPGHIAKAERQLKSQLAMVDVVLEVRDARILVSTHHPQVAGWVGAKPRLLLLNRADEVAPSDLAAWRQHFQATGARVFWTDGRNGDGVQAVRKELLKVAATLNAKRAKRGLQPRAVRACVIGFPNIGKSALINRLVKRRAVASAPKPGITRQLRWVRVDEQLDLLDAPGVIPASFRDQLAAQRLAMCNDIGEAAYLASAVGAALVLRIKQLAAAEAASAAVHAAGVAACAPPASPAAPVGVVAPSEPGTGAVATGAKATKMNGRRAAERRRGGGAGGGSEGEVVGGSVMEGVLEAMRRRYSLDPLAVGSAEDFVVALAERQFGGDLERAGNRLLSDYRSGALGRFALELPADLARRQRREAGLQAAAERRERGSQDGATDGDDDDENIGAAGAGVASQAAAFDAAAALLGDDVAAAARGFEPGEWGTERVGPAGAGGVVGPVAGELEVNSSWVEQAEAWERGHSTSL